MPDFLSSAGKAIVLLGVLLLLIGGLLILAAKVPGWEGGMGWLGRLPGDIWIKKDSFSFYFPLATSILISVIVSLVLFVLSLMKR